MKLTLKIFGSPIYFIDKIFFLLEFFLGGLENFFLGHGPPYPTLGCVPERQLKQPENPNRILEDHSFESKHRIKNDTQINYYLRYAAIL